MKTDNPVAIANLLADIGALRERLISYGDALEDIACIDKPGTWEELCKEGHFDEPYSAKKARDALGVP